MGVAWEFDCPTEQDTVDLASRMARRMSPGMTVCLDGPLGAGKTRFVRAFAAALGIDETTVSSPTYVILQHYPGEIMLHHFDLYRLRDQDEWDELGAAEYFESDGICLVEWSQRFRDGLPPDRLQLVLEITGAESRLITALAEGERETQLMTALSADSGTCP